MINIHVVEIMTKYIVHNESLRINTTDETNERKKNGFTRSSWKIVNWQRDKILSILGRRTLSLRSIRKKPRNVVGVSTKLLVLTLTSSYSTIHQNQDQKFLEQKTLLLSHEYLMGTVLVFVSYQINLYLCSLSITPQCVLISRTYVSVEMSFENFSSWKDEK